MKEDMMNDAIDDAMEDEGDEEETEEVVNKVSYYEILGGRNHHYSNLRIQSFGMAGRKAFRDHDRRVDQRATDEHNLITGFG